MLWKCKKWKTTFSFYARKESEGDKNKLYLLFILIWKLDKQDGLSMWKKCTYFYTQNKLWIVVCYLEMSCMLLETQVKKKQHILPVVY